MKKFANVKPGDRLGVHFFEVVDGTRQSNARFVSVDKVTRATGGTIHCGGNKFDLDGDGRGVTFLSGSRLVTREEAARVMAEHKVRDVPEYSGRQVLDVADAILNGEIIP